MPVMGSNLVLKWERVHEGVMRRSAEAAVEVMKRGMSLVVLVVVVVVIMGCCMMVFEGGEAPT